MRRITFLTDVEGDAAYLHRYVENSRVLKFRNESDSFTTTTTATTIPIIEFACPNAMLIFGGDVWDKGGSDLLVIRQLLDLKRRYPHRVHFVMGNRDINKMRIRHELASPQHGGVWWKPHERPDPSWTSTQRLQWILGHTMGSPNAFELRRHELERERRNGQDDGPPCVVSDHDVLQSYLDSCHAQTGEMGMYLRQANICFKLGKLFVVHGAVPWMTSTTSTQHYDLAMPWLKDQDSLSSSTSTLDWMDALNEFGHAQIRQWQLSASEEHTNGVWATKGGFDYWPSQGCNYAGLLQYGMGWLPSKERIPTVVYSSWTQTGMPRQFFDPNSREAEFTKEFMVDSDVQVILSGHQPQGDLPTPIRLGDDKLIMACDTSYSGDMQWLGTQKRRAVGGRGLVAVCEVLIEQCIDTGVIETVTNHGVLSNGMLFETTNMLANDESPVGRLSNYGRGTNQQWWVKADFVDGSQLISTAEGYDVVNSIAQTESD
jgi:hypothetical protein